MRINVADIIKVQGATKKVSIVQSEFDTTEILPPIKLSKPIQLEGKLEVSREIIYLSGILKTEVKLSCDRCTSDLLYNIESEVTDSFGQTHSIEDEESKPMESSMIDLSETIAETIALSLPMKVLCKEDCKGMCTLCGQNLNEKSCECDVDFTDPRLEKFKSLF